MKTNNFPLNLVKYTIIDLIKHLLYWPFWGYTNGFLITLKIIGKRILIAWHSLALDVWFKNIFRPMYGQYDAGSRIISFFMRVIQILFRLAIMITITIFLSSLIVIYLILPIFTIWMLYNSYGR